MHIALIRELHVQLGCSVQRAVALAAGILASHASSTSFGTGVTLAFERHAFERALQSRLVDALEMAPRPRRGRPPGRSTRITRGRAQG